MDYLVKHRIKKSKMRTVFKKSYDPDINLFKDSFHRNCYILLFFTVLLAPFFVSEYLIGELTLTLIWAIAGLGLMILVGQSGQVSLGHSAFMAIGAYSVVILQNKLGFSFLLALPSAGLISAIIGFLIALPTTKLHGIYLAILTLAISVLVEDLIVLAAPITGGVNGMFAPDIEIFTINFGRYSSISNLYWLVLLSTILLVFLYKNILRSPLGRNFAAIRDSEISAAAMGVNVVTTKGLAFAISSFYTGIAGAFFGHFATAFNYETFNVIMSITILLMIVVGGVGSIHGAFLGAIFVTLLPVSISFFRDFALENVGLNITTLPGVETGVFSIILIAFLMFEPLGLYGAWIKTRTYFELFPLYRKDMFRRQKSYLKTERLR